MEKFLAVVLVGLACASSGCDMPDRDAAEPIRSAQPAERQQVTQVGIEELPDEEIAVAVERELFSDPSTQSHKTDVEVAAGIITLTGTVDNLLAKERSERLASVVRGVRGVNNRISIRPPQRLDEDIAMDVEQALVADPATDGYEIDVRVEGQNVTLTGRVDSRQEVELAQTVAKGVRGVRSVVDRMALAYDSERRDAEIQADVEAVMRWDALVDEATIDVEVDDGKVMLIGYAGSVAERMRAATLAWVDGVRDVGTELEVRWWAENDEVRQAMVIVSDEDIEAALSDQLSLDPRVSPFGVEIEVEQGVATLTGEVSSIKAKRTATGLAANTTGVLAVQNQLEIDADTPLPDALLLSRAQAALLRSPIVGSLDIEAVVEDGVATLSGDVLHFGIRAEAEDIVEGIAGIDSVINALVVTHPSNAFVFDPYAYPERPYAFEEEYHTELVPLRSDVDIADDIREELRWSPFINAEQINVRVENGVATLRGEVNSPAEEAAALENAFEGGAIRVENNLTLRTQSSGG